MKHIDTIELNGVQCERFLNDPDHLDLLVDLCDDITGVGTGDACTLCPEHGYCMRTPIARREYERPCMTDLPDFAEDGQDVFILPSAVFPIYRMRVAS